MKSEEVAKRMAARMKEALVFLKGPRPNLSIPDDVLMILAEWAVGGVPAGLVRRGCGSSPCCCTGRCNEFIDPAAG